MRRWIVGTTVLGGLAGLLAAGAALADPLPIPTTPLRPGVLWRSGDLASLAFVEAIICCIEAAVYIDIAGLAPGRALLTSLVANAVSCAAGLALWLPWDVPLVRFYGRAFVLLMGSELPIVWLLNRGSPGMPRLLVASATTNIVTFGAGSIFLWP